MPKIREDIIQHIIDVAKIEDVVGEFVTLRKAGVNLTGCCPFHDDHHDGNFIVRPSTISAKNHGNTYRCFVCDAKGDAVKFLMEAEYMTFPDAIRWLGKKYCIEVDDVPLNWTPPPPRPTPPPPPALVIPKSWVKRTMEMAGDQNLFCYWLSHLPWNDEQRKRLSDVLWMYCVGGWKDGRVVFWGIDHDGVPRAAKLMRYYPQDHPKFGHRDPSQHPGWIYNQSGCREICDPDNHTILKPLFGAHLLRRYPQATVNIVESEKTALVMSTFYGHPDRQIWLACGGLQHLRLEAMQPLIDMNRTIWLWPDKDGVERWEELRERLGYDDINIYTKFLETCWREEDDNKADCADITIRMMTNGDQPRKVESVAESKQQSKPLEWNSEEPFIDPAEIADPWLRWARERIRQSHTPKWPTINHEPTPVGEIIKTNPIIQKLFDDNDRRTE